MVIDKGLSFLTPNGTARDNTFFPSFLSCTLCPSTVGVKSGIAVKGELVDADILFVKGPCLLER